MHEPEVVMTGAWWLDSFFSFLLFPLDIENVKGGSKRFEKTRVPRIHQKEPFRPLTFL